MVCVLTDMGTCPLGYVGPGWIWTGCNGAPCVVLATVLCYGTVHVLILALAQGEPNHIIVTRVVELLREIATFVVKDSVSDNLM